MFKHFARHFLIISIAWMSVGFAPKNPGVVTVIEAPPVISESQNNISFKCAQCTTSEKNMLPKMEDLLNEIIQSKCFADHFIDTKYRSKLIQTGGLSREQVVQKLRTLKVQNIPLIFYYPKWYQSKDTVGYTYPSAPEIYLNRLFRDGSRGKWGICAEVSNEAHEASHKMGFIHDSKRTPDRPYSVPYTVNYAVDACCDDKTGLKQ